MTDELLTPQRVHGVFLDCLFREGEDPSSAVTATGIMRTVGFHPGRLAGHDDDIRELLAQLPDQFRMDGGGGWSFLNGCVDRDGKLWTGDHATVEELFLLGIAAQRSTCLLPRELWDALPGGVPYYGIHEPAPR